jgi:AcrR family transcriptional regulator
VFSGLAHPHLWRIRHTNANVWGQGRFEQPARDRLAMAIADLQREAPRSSRYEKLRCGVRGPAGLTADEVEANQRARLYEAMLEITATRGYQAATIKAVSALAGVSRQTFYALFDTDPDRHPKEACFLGAYDYAVERAAQRISAAYDSEPSVERRLCRAFEQFAREVVSEPQAARFALLETFGAGPAALERMDRGRQRFEQMIIASVPPAVGGETLSPTIAKAVVGGVERVARVHLIEGRIDELPAVADQLAVWVASYCPRRRFIPPKPTATVVSAQTWGTDEGMRLLRATATIAGTEGYESLGAAKITELAGVSPETFGQIYKDSGDPVEACFLAAFDLLGAEALVCAARASRGADGWPDGARRGIEALFGHIAAHPYLGRVAFIEIFSVGPSAIERRSAMLRGFAEVFTKRVPEPERPSELVSEAIVGGIWAIIHDYVARAQVQRLPELAGDAVYLALAPLIGHETAEELIASSPQPEAETFALLQAS